MTNQKMLMNLREALDKLQREHDDLRKEYTKNKIRTDGEIDNLYQTKADKADLEALENRMNDLFDQIMAMMPNKEELRKKFDAINKRIRALEHLLKNMNTSDGMANEEDAMLTKKKLGPMNCASCDKGLINISGLQQNPYAWKRMPQRIEPDRIANYGPGYSWFLKNLDMQHKSALSMQGSSI